jgi:hypothetical protein
MAYNGAVLARDVEIADIDGRQWENWLRLLAPPGAVDDPQFALVWIDDAGAVVKAVIRGRGAVPPGEVPYAGASQEALAQLAAELGVATVVVLTVDALPELFARIERELRPEDDYVAQGLTMLRALKALAGRKIWSEPRLLELVPAPPYEALQRTFDLLIPDGGAMAAYVFEDDRSGIHASIIATKVRGHIDQVATHKAIADLVPPAALAGRWRGEHKQVLGAIEHRFARPTVAVFLERATYYRVLTGPTDTLARELRAKNVLIDPAPAWLLGLLGGATVAAMATRGAKMLAGFLPPNARKMATDMAKSARGAAKSAGADPWAILGFDPVELWLELRHLYRAPPAATTPSEPTS